MKVCLVLYKYAVDLQDPCCYPLGFMYVASYFKKNGHEVKVLNYNLWDYDFISEVKGSDIVCFTGFEEFKTQILRDEQVCRDLGIITIVGGALATFNGIHDFQGEYHIGEVERCAIDDIPWPDYESFGIDEYHKRHSIRYMGAMTSRGCPHSCTFCAQTCKFRMRKMDAAFDEIDFYIKKYKLEMIVINDNTLNINKPRFMDFCRRIKIPWTAAVRCQPFDDEMALAAKNSNCHYLVVGVESFNQRSLDRMNKKIKVRQISRTLDLLEKYKIDYHGNILVGFEDQTYEDIVSELTMAPGHYKLFPSMVQNFVGTKNGKTRKISREQLDGFNHLFSELVTKSGKTCYPQLDQFA